MISHMMHDRAWQNSSVFNLWFGVSFCFTLRNSVTFFPIGSNPNIIHNTCDLSGTTSLSLNTPTVLWLVLQEGFKMGLTLEGTVFSLDPLDSRCWCQEDALCRVLLTRLYEEVPKSTPRSSQDVTVFHLEVYMHLHLDGFFRYFKVNSDPL